MIAILFYIVMELLIILNNTEKFKAVAWSVVLLYGMIAGCTIMIYGYKTIISAIKSHRITSVFLLFCIGIMIKAVLDSIADQSLSTLIGRYIVVIQLLIIPLVVLGMMGIYVWKLKYWKLYLMIGSIVGIAMMILIPIGAVPDEVYHIKMAYRVSNWFLGIKNTVSSTPMRVDDCFVAGHDFANGTYRTAEQLEVYLSELFAPLANGNLINVQFSSSTTDYIYIIPALGIALGRALGLGTYITLMLGRLFNLTIYILITTYSIKLIPFGKLSLMVLLLMPMTVQQGMSYSYDVYANSLSILLISYSVKIVSKNDSETLNRKDIILMFISSMALLPLKSYAYFLISFLPWILLFIKKFPIDEHRASLIKKVIIYVILLFLTVFVIWGLTGASSYKYSISYLSYDGSQEAYSISYFIAHPFELIYVIVHTFNVKLDFYINSFIGEYLGWLDIIMPHHVTVIYIVLLILSSIKRFGDERDILPKFKKIFVAFALLTIGFICAGMLISWSPTAGKVIEGVQGRYFIACFPLILLALRSKNFQINCKSNSVILAVTVMTIFYDLEFLMIRY